MRSHTQTVILFLIALTMLLTTATAQSSRGKNADLERAAERLVTLTRMTVQNALRGRDVQRSARERFELMRSLSEKAPASVLNAALAADMLERMPANERSLFETRDKLEGELEIVAECEENDGRVQYFLHQGDTRLSLFFAGKPTEDLLSGAKVSIDGVRIGDSMVAEGSGINAVSTSNGKTIESNVLPGTTGEERVLVILVNFQDNTSQPYSTDHARDIVFNQGSNFVNENSYGQTWITGDVFGWYTLPISGASCDTASIGNYARQAAAAAGVDVSAYQHYVYGFPSTSTCGFSGRSSVGGNPSHLWINSNLMGLPVFAHEFGHSLGLFHSQSLDCGPDVIPGTCSTNEYGDTFDIMGISKTVHMNAFQKERLGWLNSGVSPAIQSVSGSGTYYVDAYETASSSVKSLKILKSVDPTTGYRTYYYIEHRTPTGFDSGLGIYGVQNGVLIHTGSESYGTETYLLDMTPNTTSWYDSMLNVGQSFTDPGAGVSFTVVSADNFGATVNVQMNAQPCVRANPTVSLTPGQSGWLSPGSAFTYGVTVTNNNSGGCSSEAFSLSANLPSGFTASFSSPSVNLANGATGAGEAYVASSTLSTDGVYNIGVSAANAANPSYYSTGSASYVVVSRLGVTATPGAVKYSRNQTATVTSVVTAAGMPVGGVTVMFTLVNPDGATGTQPVTTGADGRAVFTYRFDRRRDPLGTYQVTASTAVKSYTGQASTSFLVNK